MSSKQDVSEFQSQFLSIDSFESKPLKGLKIGFIHEKLEEGVHSGVRSATKEAASDLEGLVLGKGILDKDYLAKPAVDPCGSKLNFRTISFSLSPVVLTMRQTVVTMTIQMITLLVITYYLSL
ncbi:hypothetical protein F2Q69_00020364 [Brassica cretica]|uniref:Uncharacterized protein n=1 Tax=Brassica cretica TaxID=69181 RepID=A0A8S9QE62_BRACR|nr:hypothetical protein F2Q69_00020364 [Brassica cretica]